MQKPKQGAPNPNKRPVPSSHQAPKSLPVALDEKVLRKVTGGMSGPVGGW